MEFKSKNPFLSNKSFAKADTIYDAEGNVLIDYNNTMTVNGAVNKSFILLLLLLTGAFTVWYMAVNGFNILPSTIGGAILAFISVLVASFKPATSRYLAPAYALFEGLFIGGLTLIIDAMYPGQGIAMKAVTATFVTFIVCFGLYRFRIVKVTEQFKSIVIAATLAIATYYLISWIMSFFGFMPIHSIQNNSLMSIGISVFVIIIAALNLFLDFDLIEKSAQQRLPKYMEWFGAMGLMVTLVWLYVEFLRLFAKLSSRD
ncbi:Bax inhibitor-1/YccA family protein [Flavobacterium suzhouense]|uniref:Bax inhibitor-1/YccA family protein n=1 Tax=Flavobacterium suzhouense TaxID=1529638 RepID=A0ABW5NR98_9FLAO